jgi:predicted extracellular nuclease
MRTLNWSRGVLLRAFITLAFAGGLFVAALPAAHASSSSLVISQFQVAGATSSDEFVELHNVSSAPVDLNGYRIVYRSSAGTSDVSLVSWSTSTIVPAGGYYLATVVSGYTGSAGADSTWNGGTNGSLSGSSGGLALRQGALNTGTIIDSVGYGAATNAFVETATTSAPAAGSSQVRSNNGCTDTDTNSADFSALSPSMPRNSASPVNVCGSTTPTVTPTNTPVPGTCSVPDVSIGSVQGSGAATSLSGQTVTVQGVVVLDYEGASPNLRGFYLEDSGDGDPTTSDGIFVFESDNANRVNVGDVVQVTGVAGENQGQTQISSTVDVQPCGTTGTVAPVDVQLPSSSADYLERYEGMLVRFPQTLYVTEHFQLGRFGQVLLSSGGRLHQPTNIVAPGAAANAVQAQNDLNQILIDDDSQAQNPDPIKFARGGQPLSASNTLRGGDTVAGMVGVLSYTWGGNAASPNAYRVRPIGALDGGVPDFQPANPRPSAPLAVDARLRVVGMNLLNFFNTFSGCTNGANGAATDCRGADNQTEFNRQWPKTVAAIQAMNPDVLGVNELENDGYGPDSAIQFLVDKLNAATAPGTYAFIDADAATGQTNALGTDAIKVSMIYKPAKVTPVGQTAVLNTVAFVNGGDSAPRSRPSLAQAFQENATGNRFIVDINHLKSKGSACDIPDAGDGQGNCNAERVNAAQELVTWLASDPTGTGDPDILLVGDYNSYAMEDPITTIKNAGYTNLISTLIGEDAYSYVFDGQWGYLDHALASAGMASQVASVTEYHINSDEPSVLDYNTNFKTTDLQNTLYAADRFRVSDHDPVIVGLNLVNHPPKANDDTASVKKNGSVQIAVLANDTDVDGDTLTVTAVSSGNSKSTITINNDGTVTYEPKPGFKGTDVFTYTVSDGKGGKATATVVVTVFNK